MVEFVFLWYRKPFQHRCWQRRIPAPDFNQAVLAMEQFLKTKTDQQSIVVDHSVVEHAGGDAVLHSLTTLPFNFQIEYGMTAHPVGFFQTVK